MLKRAQNIRTGLRRNSAQNSRRRPSPLHKLTIPAVEDLKSVASDDPSAALSLLLSSSDPLLLDYPACSTLLYRLARASLFSEVDTLLLFIRSHRIPCSGFLFSALICHFSRASLPNKAINLFFSIPSFNCPSPSPSLHTFNRLLDALVDNGCLDDAKNFLSCCSQFRIRPNHVSYNIVMKGVLEIEGYDCARQLFDVMRKRGVSPTVVTYNMLIGYAGRNRELGKAMSLKEEMIRKEIYPNAATYAILMKGLCSLGNYVAARKLMFDMEYRGCKTKILNFGVLMSDCGRRGDFEEMKRLLAEMKLRKMKPDDITYSILINYLCKDNRVDDAYKVLVEMQVKERRNPSSAMYRMMLDGFCKVGEFDKGLGILNSMLASGHYPRLETFRCLVMGLVESGKVDEAWFVMEEMEKRKLGLGLEEWSSLIEKFCPKCEKNVELLLSELALINVDER